MCGLGGILRVLTPDSASYAAARRAYDNNDNTADAFGDDGWSIPSAWLETLDSAVAHRGPDGSGFYRDRTLLDDGRLVEVALVHRRLTIIDPAGGAQPMVGELMAGELQPINPTQSRRVALVFNGCIYNHAELRSALEQRGERFDSDHADTEVLLRLWLNAARQADWDPRRAHPFAREGLSAEGMYAVGVWDSAMGTVHLSRDLFGEKPMYAGSFYSGDGDTIGVFASTAAAIAELIAQQQQQPQLNINQARARRWIVQGFDTATSLWDGLYELPPGAAAGLVPGVHGVELETDFATLQYPRWPKIPKFRLRQTKPSRVEKVLRASIEKRLDADVPVACLLSGGIDSSCVSALACEIERERGRELTTICVRMPGSALDESRYAAEVAKAIGSRHITIDPPTDPAGDLVKLIESIGLPLGDSSLLPTYWACLAGAQHAKVLLTGDGGDELFNGYERYTAAEMMPMRHLATIIGFAITPALSIGRGRSDFSFLPRRNPRSKWTKLARLIDASSWTGGGYHDLVSIYPVSDARRLLGRIPTAELGRGKRIESGVGARRWDVEHYLPEDLLRKVDTASMLAGVEARAPMLSPELAMMMLERPPEDDIHRRNHKRPLRKILAKRMKPSLFERPKTGFAVPVGDWFRDDTGQMRSLLQDRLRSAQPFGPDELGLNELINLDVVNRMLQQHDDAGAWSVFPWKGRDHTQRLYMLLVLSIWADWFARVSNVQADA